MKLLKAKIEVTHENGATQYVGYPQLWLDNKEKIPAILYPKDRTDELDENGKTYQIVYPVVPDDLHPEFLQDALFSEPDLIELQAYNDKHSPSIEKISDADRVLSILTKVARNEALTPEEKLALDPASTEPGVTTTKDFLQIAKDYGCDNI